MDVKWENAPQSYQYILDNNIFGFIYCIERLNAKFGEKKYYWGCKQFSETKKLPPLKGNKNKRIKIVESDWKSYWGSSKELLKDVEKYGFNNFKKTIIKLCSCKWELKWEEMKIQVENNVLFRDDVYNGIINIRLGNAPKLIKEKYEKYNRDL